LEVIKKKTGPKKGSRGGARPRSLIGPRCAVCRHPQLYEIQGTLAAGVSQHQVAKKYGFTQPIVWKHCKEHMGAKLLEHNLSEPVLDQIRKLNQRTLKILGEAEKGKYKDPVVALQAIREARHNLELIARLTGEDKTAQTSGSTKIEIVYVDRPTLTTGPPPAIEAGGEIP
jgi:hypothetical protein